MRRCGPCGCVCFARLSTPLSLTYSPARANTRNAHPPSASFEKPRTPCPHRRRYKAYNYRTSHRLSPRPLLFAAAPPPVVHNGPALIPHHHQDPMTRAPSSPRSTYRHLLAAAATAAIGALASFTVPAHGAIVGVSTGTQNITAPADTPGFNNVARYQVGSAVYLGNRWLLTAEHVHGGVDTQPITFSDAPGSASYSQEGAGIQLTYPGAGGGPTDLALIRISQDPGLPQLQFGAPPTAGTPIVMAGFGRNRESTLTRWNSNTKPWTEASNGNQVGYKYAPGTTKRWATNVISPLNDEGAITIEYDTESTYLGKASLIGADFTRSGGTPSEGIVANGDSGGALFANNRLIGIPLYLGLFEDQPDETAVFGNFAYFANLARYVDQIATITGLHPGTGGDANLDGIVSNLDFNILRDHFGQSAGWSGGDFNLDGRVTFADFQILERNFGGTLPTTEVDALKAISVPEPAGIAIVLGAVMLLRRRNQRR